MASSPPSSLLFGIAKNKYTERPSEPGLTLRTIWVQHGDRLLLALLGESPASFWSQQCSSKPVLLAVHFACHYSEQRFYIQIFFGSDIILSAYPAYHRNTSVPLYFIQLRTCVVFLIKAPFESTAE